MLHNLLKQKNPYYSNLSAIGQTRFQERVLNFIKSKNFIGREGLVVTDEMRVLIAATAVQLTFGLRDYIISNLHSINIFPHVFYSKLFNTSFKGLTTQSGVLSLSWDDFKEGFVNEHDRLNLGLHELGHALNIELDEEKNYDEHFSIYFEKWKAVALIIFLKLKEGKIIFLRNYGSTNLHEFFAVCIEYFFESPAEFKKQLPNLYWHTMLLLNQDPDNVTEDYRIKKIADKNRINTMINDTNSYPYNTSIKKTLINNENIYIEETKIQKLIRAKGVYIAMATTVTGLFIGIPLLFWITSVTVISIGIILILIFCCGILGLIQWKFVKKYIDMEYHQFTMYAFSGFGMCLINFILLLNYTITVNTYTQTYNILKTKVNNGDYEIILEDVNNNALERNLSTYFNDHFSITKSLRNVTVTFDTGLFGFDRIRDCKFN